MKNHPDKSHSSSLSIGSELKRKSIHLLMIVIPLWYYFTPQRWGVLGLIIAMTGTVVLDLLRLTDDRLRQFFLRFFKSLIRSHEEEHLLGSTYFMIAALISVLVFDKMIAISALTFLVLGDTAAAVIGKRFGRAAYWGKSLAGSFACFICCLVIGFLLLDNTLVILFGALAAALSEALPVPMDDNMRVPIASGIVMQFVLHISQG
jgi:dolichol kinase